MARWRLTQPHYLKTVDNQWEQKETNRTSGRQAIKRYDVPRLFDPKDPGDCNNGEDCVVCWEGKGTPRDHIFFGPPTPDMEPLDEEAEAVSAEEGKNWVHPIEGLSGDYSGTLLQTFEQQLAEAIQKASADPRGPAALKTPIAVPNDRVEALEAQVAELKALLSAQQPERRV